MGDGRGGPETGRRSAAAVMQAGFGRGVRAQRRPDDLDSETSGGQVGSETRGGVRAVGEIICDASTQKPNDWSAPA